MVIVNQLLTIIHFKGTGKTGNVSWVSFLKLFVPNLCPICGRFSTLSQFVGNFVPHGSSTFQLWVWRVKQWRPRRSLTSYSWSPPPHQTCFYIKSSNFSSFLAFYFSLFCFLRICQFHVVAAIVYLFCAGIFISHHNGSSSFILINQCKKTKWKIQY